MPNGMMVFIYCKYIVEKKINAVDKTLKIQIMFTYIFLNIYNIEKWLK